MYNSTSASINHLAKDLSVLKKNSLGQQSNQNSYLISTFRSAVLQKQFFAERSRNNTYVEKLLQTFKRKHRSDILHVKWPNDTNDYSTSILNSATFKLTGKSRGFLLDKNVSSFEVEHPFFYTCIKHAAETITHLSEEKKTSHLNSSSPLLALSCIYLLSPNKSSCKLTQHIKQVKACLFSVFKDSQQIDVALRNISQCLVLSMVIIQLQNCVVDVRTKNCTTKIYAKTEMCQQNLKTVMEMKKHGIFKSLFEREGEYVFTIENLQTSTFEDFEKTMK